MRSSVRCLVLCGLWCVGSVGAQEETAPPTPQVLVPPSFDFEDPTTASLWYALDEEATLEITRERANVAQGKCALEITYTPRDGVFNLFGARNLAPRPCRSLRLALKTQEQTPVVISVREPDGSSYHAFIAAPADQWQRVEIDLAEMMLTEDTQDENGGLDTGQITELTIADLSNLPGEVGNAFGHKTGPQKMWLDAIELSPETVPGRSSRSLGGRLIRLDGFETPVNFCLPLGGVAVSHGPGAPGVAGRKALRLDYRLGQHRWAGVVCGAGHLNLVDTAAVTCHLRSTHQGAAAMVLEERDGSKYRHMVTLDGRNEWRTEEIPLGGFVRDPSTTDENDQLDLEQLRVVVFVVDTFDAGVGVEGLGTLWLDELGFLTKQ